MSYLQEEYEDLPLSFLSYDSLNSRKAKEFYAMSYVQGQRSVCPKPRIPFILVHEYWGSEETRLG